MLIAGQRVSARAKAGPLLEHEITRLARGGIPYGHHTRALGEVAELGDLTVIAELRHTGGRAPTVEITIANLLPSAPATAGLDTIHESGASLVRQLENRIADLAQRVERDRDRAAAEARNADQALQVPFKHAEALSAAQELVRQIAAAMQQRQHAAAAAETEENAGQGSSSAHGRGGRPGSRRVATPRARELPRRARPHGEQQLRGTPARIGCGRCHAAPEGFRALAPHA